MPYFSFVIAFTIIWLDSLEKLWPPKKEEKNG